MRIAIDTRPLQNASAGRGVGRYVRSLMTYLPRPDDDYDFLESAWAPAGRWPDGATGRRVRLMRPPRAITLFDQAATPLLCAWKRYDLFHSTFYALPRLGSGGAARILTIHDLIPLKVPGAVSAKNTAIFRQIYRSARAADAVIVPSARTAADLQAFVTVSASAIRVIPMGVGPPFLEERSLPAERARPALAPLARARAAGRRLLIYNGGYDATKDVPLLIEAAALLRDPTVALALTGDSGPARAPLDALARRLGIGEFLLHLGRLEDADLAAAYRASDLFVSASSYEGFGLPPLEAMACGLPVVARSAGAVPEVLEGAALGVDERDPGALAGAIRRGLEDEALRTRLRAAGHARARALTWERTAAATHALYRDAGARR